MAGGVWHSATHEALGGALRFHQQESARGMVAEREKGSCMSERGFNTSPDASRERHPAELIKVAVVYYI